MATAVGFVPTSEGMLTRYALLVCALGVAVGGGTQLACGDDDAMDACYPPDPMLEYVIPSIPHCGWRPGELPEPPDGYEYTWTVTVTFVPTDDEPCDPCDVERLDALAKAEIEEDCEEPYVAFRRGCYEAPTESDERCVVRAIYASNCNAPEIRD